MNNRDGSSGSKALEGHGYEILVKRVNSTYTPTTAPSAALNKMLSSDLRPFHLRAFFGFFELVVLAPP